MLPQGLANFDVSYAWLGSYSGSGRERLCVHKMVPNHSGNGTYQHAYLRCGWNGRDLINGLNFLPQPGRVAFDLCPNMNVSTVEEERQPYKESVPYRDSDPEVIVAYGTLFASGEESP